MNISRTYLRLYEEVLRGEWVEGSGEKSKEEDNYLRKDYGFNEVSFLISTFFASTYYKSSATQI